MTNLVNIAAKKDEAGDKQAAEIARLRELFDPAYRPQFRPGDIVRFRPLNGRTGVSKRLTDCLLIVTAIRREGESWAGFRGFDPDDDVSAIGIFFDKEEQRDVRAGISAPHWEFDLVEAYRDRSEAKE